MHEAHEIKTEMKKMKNRRTIVMALTYVIFFLPRFTEYRADPEMHYHMKQSLGLFVVSFAIRGLLGTLAPFGMPYITVMIVQTATLVYIFLGVHNVLYGKMQPLPYIGKYAERVF
jgi:hypothetical protein